MKTLFITNARSGPRRDLALLRALIEKHYRDVPFTIVPCTGKEDLDEILRRATLEGTELFVAVGGDGTVSEVGRRLIGGTGILGILPTGSGNGFARHLGWPTHLEKAIVASLGGRSITIDTATLDGIPFLATAGVGFDAHVAERFASSTVRGLQTYVREGLSSLLSYRPCLYTITLDGHRFEQRAFLVVVANSSQYGNDAKIAPRASLQDGLLDVSIVTDAPLTAVPLLIGKLFLGQLDESPWVTTLQGKHIVIEREAEGPAHMDGEPLTLGATLRFEIVPNSLRVLVPRS